ncbi:MAG: ArsB/NhaD family transporter [Kosmotoga sp.]|nr:ArsB/NhaD family transporter [Kosmotoga sp.]MBO8166233.1 ArsB/NhaD family transporter [Kosmotoga sp.]MCD6159473.1 ArsB/NhaD family transporter [Kosmotoga sp.]
MVFLYGSVVLVLMSIVYYFLVSGKMDKAASAFAGGAILLFLTAVLNNAFPDALPEGVKNLNLENLSSFVDFKTLGLLIGMMIILPFIEESGFFQFMAVAVVKMSRGNFRFLYILTSIIVGLASAFLNNVSTVMVFVPVVLAVTDALKKNPFPFLIMIILSANLGGTATLIGDPPNMIVGFAAGKSFNDFLSNVSPVVIITLVTILILLLWKESKYFKLSDEEQEILKKFANTNPFSQIRDKRMLRISLTIFAFTLVGFTLPPSLGIDPALVSLLAAAVTLFVMKVDGETMEKLFHKIEWGTIFFFLGMFTLVYGLEAVGLMNVIVNFLVNSLHNPLMLLLFVLWFPLLLSSFVSAVPMVMIMVPIVKGMIGNPALIFSGNVALSDTLWWALVLGACYGGNGTIVGAAANMVVTGMSQKLKRGKLTFSNYMRYTFPLLMVSGIVATMYVIIRYYSIHI